MRLQFAIKSGIERMGLSQRYYHARLQYSKSGDCLTHWNYEKNVIFIHIPKNAGTSVYSSMKVDTLPPDTHIPATVYRTTDPKLFESAYVFAYIRDPWDRFVSAFHYLKQGNHPNDKAMQEFLQPITDFSHFINELKNRPGFRATVMSWLHFLPQSYFLCDFSGRSLVQNLHRVENFNDGLDAVAQATGLNIIPQFENRSRRSDFREYYDVESANLVHNLYRADIELLGYRPPK